MGDDVKWNFHEMLNGANVGVFSAAVRELGKKGEANFERAMDQLRGQKKANWSRPLASSLGHSIYVIRFKDHAKTHRRVFGHFHDPHLSFVMTLLGYEKGDVYYPANYETRAREHKGTCDSNFQGATAAFPKYCEICESRRDCELSSAAGVAIRGGAAPEG